MIAIAANTLGATLYRRGTTRQLAGAVVVCVISALLLLLAITWYNLRFTVRQGMLALAEIEVALVYVSIFGWLLPLGVTITYWLFSSPRVSTASLRLPAQKRSLQLDPALAARLPRAQPGVPAPFVFNKEMPWGWLEYDGGNFHGQRLALKRVVVTLGRDEESDIWIDDEMASRHHAQLAYYQGQAYVTDCNSMNGVVLNGQRIVDSTPLMTKAVLEVGRQRFIFTLAEPGEVLAEQEDPLAKLTRRSSRQSLVASSRALPPTLPGILRLPSKQKEKSS